MLGGLADAIGRNVGRIGRRRRIEPRGDPVKVNVGSGIEVAPGWLHLDGSIHALFAGGPRILLRLLYRVQTVYRDQVSEEAYVRRLSDHPFVHCELEYGLPLASESVDFLYCSHVVEHFFEGDALRLLTEMRRVLRPGGIVRICVPDLEYVVSLYSGGDRAAALEYFFTDSDAGYYRRHRYMYDFHLLREALMSAGFTDVRRCDYRSGLVPDLELLDNRPEETLYVEAARAAE